MRRRPTTGRRAGPSGSVGRPAPAAARDRGWHLLVLDGAGEADLGRPGPWRRRDAGDGWVAELPPSVESGLLAGDEARAAFEAWAEESLAAADADGEVRDDGLDAGAGTDDAPWLAELVARCKRDVQVRAHAAPVDLVRAGGRLAVRVVLGRAGALDTARAAWLDELLAAARGQWRLVRFGRDDAGRVLAEVDLSGLPDALAASWSALALDALRAAAAWALPAVAEVLDPAPRALLDRPPPGAPGRHPIT